MKRFILILAGIIVYMQMPVSAVTSLPSTLPPAITVSSVTALASAIATVTITTPTSVGPYSTGNYTYITHLHVVAYATGTTLGSATPVTCTLTGVTGSPILRFPTAMAIGTQTVIDLAFDNALQSTIASNVVISCPATAGVMWDMLVAYYQGS
jgi:hypothetical protein